MVKAENQIQREILSVIRFLKDGAKYSQLKIAEVENDLFNYHLQQLVKSGYLTKQGDLYRLTEVGKSLVTNIDEEDKKLPANYKVSVYMCVVVNGKVLLYKRLKHPQFGYTGLPSGKIKYGEEILATARRELLEETGFRADFTIIGNLRQIRKNSQGEMVEDGVFYVCYSDKVEGSLTPDSKEGEFFWENLDKAVKLDKIFKPSLEIILAEVKKRIGREVPWENKFIFELLPDPEVY